MATESSRNLITVDGMHIRYWTKRAPAGKSRLSVVFFHGFSFSLDNWIKLGTTDLLLSKGYDVCAIDLPSGKASKSDKIKGDDRAKAIPLIEKVLKSPEINFGSHLVFIGPSMGGGFALLYAISRPAEVDGLVLISPSLKSVDEEAISALEIPVLLIWGEKDNVLPASEYANSLKKMLPRSKLILLKGARHAAYLDKTEEFHEFLIDFLEEISQ